MALPPPWDGVRGEAIDGGMVFRLPVKTQEEVDEIRRRLDDEPTLREKRGKALTYDLVSFFNLVSDDLEAVKNTIGKFRAEGFLVKLEGESNGVLRVSTVSPAGLKGRLRQEFHVQDDGKDRLVLKPIRKNEPATPHTPPPGPKDVPPVDNTGPKDVPPVETSPDEFLPTKRDVPVESTNVVQQITLLPPASPETNSLSLAVQERDTPGATNDSPVVAVSKRDSSTVTTTPHPFNIVTDKSEPVIIVGTNGVIARFGKVGLPKSTKPDESVPVSNSVPAKVEGGKTVIRTGVISSGGSDF